MYTISNADSHKDRWTSCTHAEEEYVSLICDCALSCKTGLKDDKDPLDQERMAVSHTDVISSDCHFDDRPK